MFHLSHPVPFLHHQTAHLLIRYHLFHPSHHPSSSHQPLQVLLIHTLNMPVIQHKPSSSLPSHSPPLCAVQPHTVRLSANSSCSSWVAKVLARAFFPAF